MARSHPRCPFGIAGFLAPLGRFIGRCLSGEGETSDRLRQDAPATCSWRCGLRQVPLEEASCREGVPERASGPHGGRDHGHFGQFFSRHAGFCRLRGMNVEAIGALGGESDRERDQFAVFRWDGPVVAFAGLVEGQERSCFHRCEGRELRRRREVFGGLIDRHGITL